MTGAPMNVSKPINALSTEQAGMVPATEQLYFKDTYLFKSSGKVLTVEIVPHPEDAKTPQEEGVAKLRIVLDKTIFHPQGGGQPSDVGTITDKEKTLPELNITFTHLNKECGTVYHDCNVKEDIADIWVKSGVGKEVDLEIDEAVRRASAKFHSAGHLIDACMKELNTYKAHKGMHFPGVCYVEFQLTKEEKEALDKDELMKALTEKIAAKTEDGEVEISRDEKNVRTISIGGCQCACGGTHVQNTSELSNLKIKSLKMKKDVLKVSYEVN